MLASWGSGPAAYAPYHQRLLLLGLSCLLHLCCWWVPLPRCANPSWCPCQYHELSLNGLPLPVLCSTGVCVPSSSREWGSIAGPSPLEITNATSLGARPLEAGPRSSLTGEGCRHGGWRHIATKPAELLRPRLVRGRNTEVHAVDPREEVIEPRVTFVDDRGNGPKVSFGCGCIPQHASDPDDPGGRGVPTLSPMAAVQGVQE